jgi:predicted methyltransferase
MIAGCALREFVTMACGVFALLVTGPLAGTQPAHAYATLLAVPDRSDADRQADKRRDPAPFLAFAGLRPGMKVLDRQALPGPHSVRMI